jgi:hypothetical protein
VQGFSVTYTPAHRLYQVSLVYLPMVYATYRSENVFLTTRRVRNVVFWVMAPSTLVDYQQHLGG